MTTTDAPMSLGFSTWAMPKLPIDQQVAIVRDAGYAAIELVSLPDTATDAHLLDAAERRRIRRLIDDAGLQLPSIAGHGNLWQADAEKRAEAEARVRRNIDLAVDLAGSDGPPCVVSMGYGKPDSYEADREPIAEGFARMAEYAGSRGVVLALEPHVGQAIDRTERVIWLMERVGSPHFRLNLDNSHFEVIGEVLDDYVDPLVPLSVHTHLKDQRGVVPKYEFLVPGEGDFDYARYLAAMQRAGYRGAVTVEISKMIQTRPGYDPAEVARRSFETLMAASRASGVPVAHREPAAAAAR
jgi:sugar phosphate isomerase/epimerase